MIRLPRYWKGRRLLRGSCKRKLYLIMYTQGWQLRENVFICCLVKSLNSDCTVGLWSSLLEKYFCGEFFNFCLSTFSKKYTNSSIFCLNYCSHSRTAGDVVLKRHNKSEHLSPFSCRTRNKDGSKLHSLKEDL